MYSVCRDWSEIKLRWRNSSADVSHVYMHDRRATSDPVRQAGDARVDDTRPTVHSRGRPDWQRHCLCSSGRCPDAEIWL